MTPAETMRDVNKRTPYDGEPFYCEICGAGFDEWGACEEVDCRLEPISKAQARRNISVAEDRKP